MRPKAIKTNQINFFFEETEQPKSALPTKKWIKLCVSKEKHTVGVLNFIFCSDKHLLRINKKYLKHNSLTDVITFIHTQPSFIKIKNHCVCGDVFISLNRVQENSKTYNTIFAKELKRVMIHGVLHLMGFNDKTEADRVIMLQKENIYTELE